MEGGAVVTMGTGGEAHTRGLAVASRQLDRDPRHERGRDEGRGVDGGRAEDGVRMRGTRGEQGERLGGQLVVLDHEAMPGVSDAGPGPVTTAGGHRVPGGGHRGHRQSGVAGGSPGRPRGGLGVVLKSYKIIIQPQFSFECQRHGRTCS